MEKPILAAMLSCSSTELNDNEKYLFSRYNPVGVTLFGRNIHDKEQLKKLISSIKEVIGREDVLIAVDQEGGRVRRLAEPEFRSYLSQKNLGSLNEDEAVKACRFHATLISRDCKELGINWNYAPVLDLAFPDTSEVLLSRCFGSDEKKAALLGKVMVEAYIQNGICPCIKHIPGHGRVSVDPHLQLPVLNYSLKDLEKDFYPFQQLKDAPAGMTAHILIPEIDPSLPVTQSAKAVQTLIRGIIGFDGFLISDAIDMKALNGSLGEKARTSLAAGCDAVCYCLGDFAEMREVCDNVRIMSDKSMIRFAKIKNIINNTNKYTIDFSKIEAEYDRLAGKAEKYIETYDATEVLHQLKHKQGE